MNDALFPGVEIEIAGRKWVVPPLTLGQIRRLAPTLAIFNARDEPGLDADMIFGAIVKIVTAALRRNYPDLTEDLVEEMLDMGNAPQVFLAVLTGSGLRRSGAGEAAAPSAGGDGAISTVFSRLPSAGASATSTS